jgi:ubiquinone/menaquinone biosynthesis C-methylase UbiE
MSLLDCGYGTITLGLAELVAPARVVGIDLDADRIVSAQRTAAERALANVAFQVGDLYQLPFPDGSFDAAFAHAVLMYAKEPIRAAQEIRRVLGPGGIFGVRDSHMAAARTFGAYPDPLLDQSWEVRHRWYAHRGTDLHFGSRLRGVLSAAGFQRVQASASCDSFGTPEAVRTWAATVVRVLQQGDLVAHATAAGWTDRESLDRMCAAWTSWGERPDAFHASVMGEAVGWNDD